MQEQKHKHTEIQCVIFGFVVCNIGLTNEPSIKLFTVIYILLYYVMLHISKWMIIKTEHKYEHISFCGIANWCRWLYCNKYIYSFTIVSIHHRPRRTLCNITPTVYVRDSLLLFFPKKERKKYKNKIHFHFKNIFIEMGCSSNINTIE